MPEPSLRTNLSQWTRRPPETRAFFLVRERRPVELASCWTGVGRPWSCSGSWLQEDGPQVTIKHAPARGLS